MTGAPGQRYCIGVVGAGIAGLSAAIALHDKGHQVTVLERSGSLQTLGGALGMNACAMRILDQYDLLQTMIDRFGELGRDRVQRRWQDGRPLMKISTQATKESFGSAGVRVMRAEFQQILYDATTSRGINVQFGVRIDTIDTDAPSLTLTDGKVLAFDLIVGADGLKSTVKQAWARDKNQLYSHSNCYMATIPYSALVGNQLIAPYLNVLNFWWGADSVVVTGLLNAHGELTYTLEFCMMDNTPHNGGSTPRFVKRADIAHNWAAWDPALTELLSFCDDYFVWPLAYTDPTLDWTSASGKVVLIGDAAHGVLPHVGAGATLALEDGATLAECLSPPTPSSAPTPTLPDLIHAYVALRRPRTSFFHSTAMSRFRTWNLPDGPAQRARDVALSKIGGTTRPIQWTPRENVADEPPPVAETTTDAEAEAVYMNGHDAVGYARRRMTELFGS